MEQQEIMARHMSTILGSALVTAPLGDSMPTKFPSPVVGIHAYLLVDFNFCPLTKDSCDDTSHLHCFMFLCVSVYVHGLLGIKGEVPYQREEVKQTGGQLCFCGSSGC